MALNIEAEKKSTNWVMVTGVIIVLAIVFIGGYFLFFKNPGLIESVVPNSLENLSAISKISFNPSSILNVDSQEKSAEVFQLLRQYETVSTPPTPGRTNPFKPL